MSPQTWWYLSRSSGMVAAVLLLASLVWGVLLSTRALKPIDRPAWLLSMHRWLTMLAVVATGVHLAALVADGYVHFGPKELLVPMASTWKPGAVALGVVALYLLVLVTVTSVFMRWLPKRLWRAVHATSYAMGWLAVVHGAMAGTDASNRVYQAVALLLVIAAVSATALRVVVGRHAVAAAGRQRAPRTSTPGSAPVSSPSATVSTPPLKVAR